MRNVINYLNDESGASATEYALIIALIATAILIALATLGTNIRTKLLGVANAINRSS